MRHPLSVIRRRVDRLVAQNATAGCGGNHRRHRWVTVYGDDPAPPWTAQEQVERCDCGAELEYFTVVDEIHGEPHPDMHPQRGNSCAAP